MAEREPEPEPDSQLSEEEARDDKIESAPFVCDICGTEVDVNKWLKPYWAIRCRPHDPRKYGGNNEIRETQE